MTDLVPLECQQHGLPLRPDRAAGRYGCDSGCCYPITGGVARFVSEDGYASAFGWQWNAFPNVQLDSYTGLSISRERLTRLFGGSLDALKGKVVLEPGCGAGRFTELMLAAGAKVFACDLSEAVEANHQNCRGYRDYFVCQADLLRLPVAPAQFEVVVCIGVVQHTPDPEQTMTVLCSHVKPGGMLVIDHYTHGYPATLSRRVLRSMLLHTSPRFSLRACRLLVALLWPAHRFLWRWRGVRGFTGLRRLFLKLSPLVDYHESYPQLGPKLLRTWALLDTHDTVTDVYKHLRSAQEIKTCLQACGMVDIEVAYAGNGIEARARKPQTPESGSSS
jgi:SAM-dependent methyltransferase